MMLVTCEPLEGEFACLCGALTGGRHFVKEQGHLGLEAHIMDDAPLLLGHLDEGRFFWRHLRVPCRLFASLPSPNNFPLEAMCCTFGV
jgi:hypothetical protein